VTDNTANCSATNRTDRTATRQDGATDRTDAGTDSRVLILAGHSGASAQTKQYQGGNRSKREFVHRSHGITSFSEIEHW
jgi:hypothetical protein